jgi:cytochrome c
MSRIPARLRRDASLVCLIVAGAAACRGETAAREVADGGAARVPVAGAPEAPARYGVGRSASAAQVAALDVDVNPAGTGLPAGRGTAAEGAAVYAAKCTACHGARAQGLGPYPRLVGRDPRDGFPFGTDPGLVKTVGNYWSHSTTLYDYVRRAMPLTEPGTLRPDEVYALVAYLLAENEIIGRDAVMYARTLPAVRMPARDRFVPDDRRGGRELR